MSGWETCYIRIIILRFLSQSNRESIQQDIRKLQIEAEEQRQRMEQASKALNFCVTQDEFEGSSERVSKYIRSLDLLAGCKIRNSGVLGRGRAAAVGGDSHILGGGIRDQATVYGGRNREVDTAEGEASVHLARSNFHVGTVAPVEGRLHPGACFSVFHPFHPFSPVYIFHNCKNVF